jgi:hypothetical protein
MESAITSDTSQECNLLALPFAFSELEIETNQTIEQATQRRGRLLTEPDTTSPPQCPSSSTSQDLDYFASLPSELLIKIIADVPSKSFLDIVHTSKFLRQFVKVNAAAICNRAILSRYRLESKLLKAELVSGWLVPTHQDIKAQEEAYNREALERNKEYESQTFKYFSLLGDRRSETADNFIAVSCPGPLFLLFLQDGVFQAEPYDQECHLGLKSPTGGTGWKEVSEGGLEYFCWFRDIRWNFEMFLTNFNEVWLTREDGRMQVPDSLFDKELIWYYGVERLEFEHFAMENGGNHSFE